MYRLLFVFILALFGFSILGCRTAEPPDQEVIIVRIPPFTDPNRSYGENLCVFNAWLDPLPETDLKKLDCSGWKDIYPNYDGYLSVNLGERGNLTVNSMPTGNISDPTRLTTVLTKAFEERRKANVLRPHTRNIEKTVGLKLPATAKYRDLITVARAVKESGAEPIILLLDKNTPVLTLPVEN